MAAGLFGYLGYDMVRAMERLPEPNPDPLGVPDAILIRPRVMVVFDADPRPDHRRLAGAARGTASRPGRPTRTRSSASTASRPPWKDPCPIEARVDLAAGRRIPSRSRTRRRTISSPWWRAPRSTSSRATSSRWCCPSASRRRSRCRPSACTARSGARIRRRSSATSISRPSRSSVPRRRSSCGCGRAP